MSATLQSCRINVLVKALPQRSAKHGETVCCAGVTSEGQFKRLYPVRFRHLQEGVSFRRWDWIDFKCSKPPHDSRHESCRVFEDSIIIRNRLSGSSRSRFLNPLVMPSVGKAAELGFSLALIRPIEPRFTYRRKTTLQLQAERTTYKEAAAQGSLFDDDLDALEPTPFEFRFKFRDSDAPHDYANGDWEAHAMFFNAQKRGLSEKQTLDWMDHTFNVDYANKGMLFAIGNQAKRPQTWQLLGVLRVDDSDQGTLAF